MPRKYAPKKGKNTKKAPAKKVAEANEEEKEEEPEVSNYLVCVDARKRIIIIFNITFAG